MANERIRMALKESARPMEALSIRFVEDQNLWIMVFEEERPVFLAARGRDSRWGLSAPIGELRKRRQIWELLADNSPGGPART